MINDAKIDFQLIGHPDMETLAQEKFTDADPYKQLLATIAALKDHHAGFSIIIQVVDGALLGPDNSLTRDLEFLLESLTKREMEVYNLAMKGFSNRLIAEKLFITIETVKSHRKSIVGKAGVRSIEEIKDRILEANKLINE